MESRESGSIFFLWALDKLKRIAYNNYCDNLILLMGINHNFIVFAVLDIIKVGLYLLSRLQNPSWQIVDRLSQTDEKGIFYGAVLARSGIFLLYLNMWAKRNAAEKRYTVSHWRSFVFKEKYGK